MKLFPWKKKETPSNHISPARTVSVLMSDGTIDEYPENFLITDKVNCVICNSNCYHFALDCEHLKWETEQGDPQIKGLTIKEAKKMGKYACMDCDRELYLFNHDENEREI